VVKSRRQRYGLGRAILQIVSVAILVSVSVVWVLRWYPPPTTTFILRTQYFSGSGDPGIEHRWAPWGRIAPHMALAVIAAEDQKFPLHWGFDFQQIRNAVQENKQRTHARGASTITQQVAKNLFLWPGRSYLRKGLEAYFTVVLELLWSKQRILEVYLNIAEFAPGVFGVAAASARYLGKSATDVNAKDAALLAAVLPNPRRLKFSQPSPYLRGRAQWIRRQMEQLGGVSYLNTLKAPTGSGLWQ
jgi:monofunctional biosynthetic peptidoglycan transglycosylase